MVKIRMLKAGKGDCFLIEHEDNTILIDGGLKTTYRVDLKKMLKDKKIDLLIVSHIDNDHINGIVSIFEDPSFDLSNIKQIWFNSASILNEKTNDSERMVEISSGSEEKGVSEGIFLEEKLNALGCWHSSPIKFGSPSITIGKMKICVLAPFEDNLKELDSEWTSKKEILELKGLKSGCRTGDDIPINLLIKNKEELDDSPTNRSSIAILIKVEDKNLLFPGDTTSKILLKALKKEGYSKENPINLDILKLPHHGSRFNMCQDFLEVVDCSNFLISTSGGGKSYHPDKECLARIITANKDKDIKFFFNYSIFDDIFLEEDRKSYPNFQCFKENNIEL